jgi:hypothetical protein
MEKLTRDQVQWAAQFAMAAELARRRYSAAFFLGNQPAHDLLCKGEKDFRVQIKGFSWAKPKSPTAKGNYVPIHDLRTGNGADLIVIVYVPQLPAEFEFFIATRKDLSAAEPETAINPKTNKPYAPGWVGICYRNFEKFKDRWQALPPAA